MYCEADPAPVIAIVPDEVTGLFETVNAEGIETPTLFTVPAPLGTAHCPSPL